MVSSAREARITPEEILARARAVIAQVPDPEIPVLSVVELGILREVVLDADGTLQVALSPTYSGCPATATIRDDVAAALAAAQLGPVRIALRLSPPWTSDWISEEGRRKLRDYGIAPPVPRALRDAPVACPHCGSTDTERLSEFGSTPCKALHRCRACREPFDRFKCI
ncbi:MAG: phenylacetate-CoA oxygenase subunit PaaJ [Gammaproteobacteria bacterium]|nr:phenylacetate-CoA oxygenase subunit PaaJ [Gammaproteobacteria bacterium]